MMQVMKQHIFDESVIETVRYQKLTYSNACGYFLLLQPSAGFPFVGIITEDGLVSSRSRSCQPDGGLKIRSILLLVAMQSTYLWWDAVIVNYQGLIRAITTDQGSRTHQPVRLSQDRIQEGKR